MRDEPDWERSARGPAYSTSRYERRTLIENHGGTVLWINKAFDNRIGKFFPRGCRGWIDDIEIHCYDSGLAGGTITVYLAPYIGCGIVQQATIAVPPGGPAAWRAAAFNTVWLYDALFIYAVGSTNDLRFGYDTEGDPDTYESADAGLTWNHQAWRLWARVLMKAETAGDVPVAGRVDIIKLPAGAATAVGTNVTVPNNTETPIVLLNGAGHVLRISWRSDHDAIECRIYIDRALFHRLGILGSHNLLPQTLNTLGYTATTPQIQLMQWADGGYSYFAMQIPFEFRHSISISAFHTTGVNQLVWASIVANVIR